MNTHKLRHLTILRHGPSDREGFLTPDGQRIICARADELAAKGVVNKQTEFLCSNKLRALKTLQCIYVHLGIDADEGVYDELFSLEEVCDVPGAMRVIEKHARDTQTESMVVVTHLEMAAKLPAAILKALSFSGHIFERDFQHGQGVTIDCAEKTETPLR